MNDIQQRFMAKVDLEQNSCWEWIAATDVNGYGRFWYKDQMRLAHRISYILFVEDVPEDLCILHSCDNRACVNPSHLFLGTQKDNIHDMIKKGRGRTQNL